MRQREKRLHQRAKEWREVALSLLMEGHAEQLLEIQTFLDCITPSNIGTEAMACLMNTLVDEIRQKIIKDNINKEISNKDENIIRGEQQ